MRTERIDEVLRHCHGLVLDLGCAGQADRRSALDSTYWLHGRIIERFPDAWGLEYSTQNADELLLQGMRNIRIGDAQNFDLEERFDTVVAGEIIEHLPNPGGMLTSAARHLKPGGRIIVTTPYVFSGAFTAYAWLKFPKTCSNTDHTMWYCPSTMSVLAGKCGLAVASYALVDDRRPDLPSRWARAYSRSQRLSGRLPLKCRASNMVHVLVPEIGQAVAGEPQ